MSRQNPDTPRLLKTLENILYIMMLNGYLGSNIFRKILLVIVLSASVEYCERNYV